MLENLNEMVKTLNSGTIPTGDSVDPTDTVTPPEVNMEATETKEAEPVKPVDDTVEIPLTNFYDWYEANTEVIHNVSRVKAEVSNISPKDSMIFKIKKNKKDDDMELVSFYNPAVRPILNLPPVYLKIFKNDAFECLHQCNNEIYIKSYGVKTGLIVVYCVNVDGKIIPFEKTKIKKNIESVKLMGYTGMAEQIKSKLTEEVDNEVVQLLYKQAIKFKEEFTTKEKTIEWFLKKSGDVIDINHLLKIDNVIINIMK